MLRVSLCVVALVLAFSTPINAEEEPEWIQAGRWASNNDGIGIAVRLGRDVGFQPEEIEANLERGFLEVFGVQANAFVSVHEGPRSAIAYFYLDASVGPESFQTGTTMERMQQVVDAYLAAHILFND